MDYIRDRLDLDREEKPEEKHIIWFALFLMAGCLTFASYLGYILFVGPDLYLGHTKFTMEPVSHAGLDTAAPPAFNVTLHATSTYKQNFCTSGSATVRAAYSGVTIAVGHVAPFCIEPKGSTVITATALSGWPALPTSLRERIDQDRRNGGVELEVDLSFNNEVERFKWVRCRRMLDATHTSSCKSFFLR